MTDLVTELRKAPSLVRDGTEADQVYEIWQLQLKAADEIERLQSELAECKRDGERLNWMQRETYGAVDSEKYMQFRIYWGYSRSIRKAIDAAMSKGGEE